MDFASDEKATKRTARKMLEMSREINGRLLKDLPVVDADGRAQVVSCYTCHRGQPKPPRSLEVLLSHAYSSGGIDAVVSEYRSLREEHFAAGRYDFRPGTLTSFATNLAAAGRSADALALLQMNLDLHPGDAEIHANLGTIQLASGELELAAANFEQALAEDPDNWLAQRGLMELAKVREAGAGGQ